MGKVTPLGENLGSPFQKGSDLSGRGGEPWIIISDERHEIGSVHTPSVGITDAYGALMPPQPLYIVREATHEEWAASVLATGGNPEGWGPYPHYYEISTD